MARRQESKRIMSDFQKTLLDTLSKFDRSIGFERTWDGFLMGV